MLRIHSLFLKPTSGAPMRNVRALDAVAGYGLVGDCNANIASPRQVLLVSRDSLNEMRIGNSDLRANLVIDGDLDGIHSGTIITFRELTLRITIPCEPCGKLNAIRPGLSSDIGSRRGLLARVLSGGTLRLRDCGTIGAVSAQPLAPNWKARVRHIIMHVPEGKVITYAALATVAGVQSAYCRALPAVLRTMASADVPVHRVVPSDVRKMERRQLHRLRSEGIDIEAGTQAYWNNAQYFAGQES
jgi:alkylated DNA nucleotide flippase Atl1